MSNRTKNVFDTGATHTEDGIKLEEAAIALRYGLSLKDAFRSRGHETFMTRDDDTDHAPVGEPGSDRVEGLALWGQKQLAIVFDSPSPARFTAPATVQADLLDLS